MIELEFFKEGEKPENPEKNLRDLRVRS